MSNLIYLVDVCGGDEFIIDTFVSEKEAIKEARARYRHMTGNDRYFINIELRMYNEDIENPDCDNFDYDLIDWHNDLFQEVNSMNQQEVILALMLITVECYPDVYKYHAELMKLTWLLSAHYNEY